MSTTFAHVIVRLLGPVEVAGPHGLAVLSGRQRVLVGLLALEEGQVVSRSRVVDAFWGDGPPRTAVKSLHSQVVRVRRALHACGLSDVLRTRGSGYAFAVGRAEVDACRFEDEVARARDDRAEGRWAAVAERLRAALALWRGEPVQDGELSGWAAAEVTRLVELRLTAQEDLWDAQLRLGRHAMTADEVDRVLVHHPLRERLVKVSMLALYRSGRPLDALEAYRRLRTRLVGELGVDPAPELQRLYVAILRHEPSLAATTELPDVVITDEVPVLRPAQLPPQVGHFTGRTDELRALDRMREDAGGGVAVISGPGGMGKTALAVQWGHRVRDTFPDGQIFLDLRGCDTQMSPAAPAEALTHLVRGLGIAGGRVPADLLELTNLYRSLLDGRRMLILVDDAVDADQVRPLVPPRATSLLVVTARRPLAALATYHAVHAVHLESLGEVESLELIRAVAGWQRVDREPESAAAVVACCGGLPLALRIAAARLASQPHGSLAAFAAELVGEHRLDALTVDEGSRSVRTALASAYRTLSGAAARVFRLLGLHPGATFARQLAAAVADVPPADADRGLSELVDACLADEVGPGRLRFHNLVKLYAVECAQHEEPPERRAEATERLVDWYLGVAQAASHTLDRGRDPVTPTLRHPPPALPFAANHLDTMAFLDGERENLTSVVRFAGQLGRHAAAWQLAYLLTGYFASRSRWEDRVEICRLGLTAAQHAGDPAAECLLLSGLGVAHIMTRRFDDALRYLYQARDLARTNGDQRREGLICNSIATAQAGLRHFVEALAAYRDALVVHRAAGDRLGIALALNNIATAHIHVGQPELSLEELASALAVSQEINNPRIEACVRHTLGEAHLRLGDHRAALEHLRHALDIRRAIGDRRHEVNTLNMIGAAALASGDAGRAVDHLQEALRLSQDLADEHLVSICLTHLGSAHLRRDEPDAADACLRRALGLRIRVPDAYEEATIHRALADLAQRTGRRDTADTHRQRAISLYHEANASAEVAELTTTVAP